MKSFFMDEARVKRRLREDFRFVTIVRFSVVSAVVLSGIVIYRFAFGYFREGMIDALMLLGVLLVLLHTLRTGETQRSGRLFATMAAAAAFASSMMFGVTGLFWGYVVLWINFLLATPRFALLLNLLLLTALGLQHSLFESVLHQVTFILTGGLVILFGSLFRRQLAIYQVNLERLALHDPLTRTGNRRAMRRKLIDLTESTHESGKNATIVLLDIDHFKQINDRFGHDVGDRLLMRFAELIHAQIRKQDQLFRFGGEEFVVVLNGLTPENADATARRIHSQVSGVLEVEGEPIRFSAGLAHLERGENWTDWLYRADQAMYHAKQAGRNRVIAYQAEAHSVPTVYPSIEKVRIREVAPQQS